MASKTINCAVPITYLKYFKNDFWLEPGQDFELEIDYPLSSPAKFKFNTGSDGMGFVGLSTFIGKCYAKIYDNCEKYGVWGHDIEDLRLTGIQVDIKNKTIRLYIGS
jgi:hypothetical protein